MAEHPIVKNDFKPTYKSWPNRPLNRSVIFLTLPDLGISFSSFSICNTIGLKDHQHCFFKPNWFSHLLVPRMWLILLLMNEKLNQVKYSPHCLIMMFLTGFERRNDLCYSGSKRSLSSFGAWISPSRPGIKSPTFVDKDLKSWG